MKRVAALGMYDLAEVRAATDTLWTALARALRDVGFADVPDALERDRALHDQWTDPSLLFAQVCGYPLLRSYARALRVVATPCHAVEGCAPGEYRSAIVVGAGARVDRVEDLRGAVAAINEPTSHSGWNALAAHASPAAIARTLLTGSHVASLAAVARGDADVAAIDCVTHALLARHRASALEGTRVLGWTVTAPAPPYVTRAATSDEELTKLRAALASVFDDAAPAVARAREALLLTGVRVLPADAYERIAAIERSHGRTPPHP